ncbi:unnamed protein product [Chironomus riparius]|uniref:Tudor domain-containing protein n=1 Tax=Chironomus riparius TaxID=315576 RepID=A0A9N9WWP1_9DIPT|nr:unnamed protein product [Chironomus riparius]
MSNSLYKKSFGPDHDDIWDDTLLIKAYEESLKVQKEEIAKNIAMKTNKKNNPEEIEESSTSIINDEKSFKVGDFVRSTYEDNVDYEAEILSINENGTALIRYIGYGNEQKVKKEDLVASWGFEAREEQKLLAEADKPVEEDRNHQEELHNFILNKSSGVHSKLPIPPMPPLPPGMFNSSRDTEYMSAMLMSWYMSGYYTGLYHGRKEAKDELSVSIAQQPITKKLPSTSTKEENPKHDRKRQKKRSVSSKSPKSD